MSLLLNKALTFVTDPWHSEPEECSSQFFRLPSSRRCARRCVPQPSEVCHGHSCETEYDVTMEVPVLDLELRQYSGAKW
jgi:hypothetical protein